MNHPNPFCDNCGAPINPGACFCGACGQALDGEPAATAPNMTFWLLVPFIPMVNFLACWFAPMRIGHKFFMLGIVIVFWTCVLVPEICKSAAYCFVGCFFVVFYYVALIIGRKRQQSFTTGAAVTFVVFNPDLSSIIAEASRKELQNDKKATAEFKKKIQDAQKALK